MKSKLRRLQHRVVYGVGALFYGIFNSLVLALVRAKPIQSNVAIVYPDYLGDVLMWFPFGQALVLHLLEQGKQIYIVCDASNQDFLQAALPECEIVGIPFKAAYLSKPKERALWLLRLRSLGVSKTYYMSHPRGPINRGESFVQALGAPAVAFDRCIADRPMWEIHWTNRHYQQLVTTAPGIETHVQKHFAVFLEAVNCADESITAASLPSCQCSRLSIPYWVLAPGASRVYRQWPAERFAAIADYVAHERPDWRCVIVGTTAEQPLAAAIAAQLGDSAIDLTGKTSVSELIEWIAHARLVLGNDSAAGHIAAAMGAPAVVVVGGGHWGRCYPYPPDAPVRRLPVAVGHAMPCFGCDWYCVHTTRTDQPFPCVEAVSVDAVCRGVDAVLNEGARSADVATLACDPPARHTGAQWQAGTHP
jgi:ADP-heptose:LPS heptosyltransferase